MVRVFAKEKASRLALKGKRPRLLVWVFFVCAEYERQLGGGSPLSSLMTAKD
jgi:hypothetical protein